MSKLLRIKNLLISDEVKKLHKIFFGVLFLLLLNSLYLFLASRNANPPRSEFAGFFYLLNVALHFGLGILLVIPVLILVVRFIKRISNLNFLQKGMSGLTLLTTLVCLGFGIYLLFVGATAPHRQALTIHTLLAGLIPLLAAGSFFLLARRAHSALTVHHSQFFLAGRISLASIVVIALLGLILWGVFTLQGAPQRSITNPSLPPLTPFEEGDGKEGLFFPSSAQTAHKDFFPSEYFTDSQSCKTCHEDIYNQWFSSMHHFSSFNNQWYRKSIEYMQQVIGTKSSKWCGGCHDMAVLLTEMPGTGKSRMDFPIKDQIDTPEAQAGIGCATCHSIVHVKSTMGQGDYLADYPPMHKYAITKNELAKKIHNFLILRAPEPHKKTFLKPFHRQDTAKFCSSCHKVHLDIPINNYRWFRGFNEFDAWQVSGVSGQGARAFYYPMTEGKYDFKKCGNCHMPLVPSKDKGNINGFVHSHRFPAANTAVSFANKDTVQFEASKKILTDGALTLDLFAMRRPRGIRNAEFGMRNEKSAPRTPHPALEEEPRSSSLFEAEPTGDGRPSSDKPLSEEEEMIALMDKTLPSVVRGEEVIFDVVARTRKLGHAFPGGTIDAFDVWLELMITDENDKIIYWNGELESPDGPVDRSAHFYGALLVDAHGTPINKRNAWAARSRVYSRVIPPGAADVAHFRVKIPENCGDSLTLHAKLNYRKFHWYNTQFAFAGRSSTDDKDGVLDGISIGHEGKDPLVSPHFDDREWLFDANTSAVSGEIKEVPKLPIIVVAEKTIKLPVTSHKSQITHHPLPVTDVVQDRERWNDYGIGLLLQRDFLGASEAFRKVIEIAPEWPEGWVNLGRTSLEEGNLNESKEALDKALELYKKTPNLIYHRARTLFFYGLILKRLGQYDEAAQTLEEAKSVFPNDRFIRNELGRIRFLQRQFDEAIAEFEKTLSIDPEDLTAHYNLMLSCRGKGDLEKASVHEKYYFRFKADEPSTQIVGPYKRANPWHNNEAQLIHEHEDKNYYKERKYKKEDSYSSLP